MRYQELFKSTNDSELYRLELIESIGNNIPWFKREAESVLGRKIRAVKLVGAINDPVHFSEDAEVNVAFYLVGTADQVNDELTEQLQNHFANLPLEDVGVINAIVLQKA